MGISFLMVHRDNYFHKSTSQECVGESISTKRELSLLQQNHKCIQEFAIASERMEPLNLIEKQSAELSEFQQWEEWLLKNYFPTCLFEVGFRIQNIKNIRKTVNGVDKHISFHLYICYIIKCRMRSQIGRIAGRERTRPYLNTYLLPQTVHSHISYSYYSRVPAKQIRDFPLLM